MSIEEREREGYGSRIYVQQKKRFNFWPYLIILALFAGTWFLFQSLKPEVTFDPDPGPGSETVSTDFSGSDTYSGGDDGEYEDDAAYEYADDSGPVEEYTEDPALEQAFENPEPPGGFAAPGSSLPSEHLAILKEARRHFDKKQYKKALTLMKPILENYPEKLVDAGICCFFLKDYQNARHYLKRAVEHDTADFKSLKYLALSCYRLNDLDGALKYSKAALEMKQDSQLAALNNQIGRENQLHTKYEDMEKLHFTIQFSRHEHLKASYMVLTVLNSAYRNIGKKLDYYPEESVPVILYNEKSFFDITRAPGWAGGLYDGKIRIPIKGIEGKEAQLKRILFHEYTHALIHQLAPWCPRWVNEGLAQYFSEGSSFLSKAKKIRQLIPLEKLEQGWPANPPNAVAAAYYESVSAVIYLISRYRLVKMKVFLEELGKLENVRNAFKAAFPITYKEFKQRWGGSKPQVREVRL